MKATTASDVVDVFLALPQEEQEEIFQIGAAFRLVDLRKQLALAEENIGRFEARYGMTLDELENQGLPEDADYQMHEDYVEWHYWVSVRDKTRQMLNNAPPPQTSDHLPSPQTRGLEGQLSKLGRNLPGRRYERDS